MKSKIVQAGLPKRESAVSCLEWIDDDCFISCGDDRTLSEWDASSGERTFSVVLPGDSFPLEVRWCQSSERLLLATADGDFRILDRKGRTEKTANAHRGACTIARWSPDGSSILTAGEDGRLRVWSRGALPRATLAAEGTPIRCAVWAGSSVAYARSRDLAILRPRGDGAGARRWRAHDGLVLSLAWNAVRRILLSGGEDRIFKTWDPSGRPLSRSPKQESPVMSVSWAPDGNSFAVGGFDSLRICDRVGWSRLKERPPAGSVREIAWSPDGTRVAMAGSSSGPLVVRVLDVSVERDGVRCEIIGTRSAELADLVTGETEILRFSSRAVGAAVAGGRSVVVTATECHVRSPDGTVVFERAEGGSVSAVLASDRFICLAGVSGLAVYGLSGRPVPTPSRLPLGAVALGADALATADGDDPRIVRVHRLPDGAVPRSSSELAEVKIEHRTPVVEIALDRTGDRLSVIDANRDLYVTSVREPGARPEKTAVQVSGAAWCDDASVLVVLKEGKLFGYGPPSFRDPIVIRGDAGDLGKDPTLLSAEEGRTTLRKTDGSVVHAAVSPFPMRLDKRVSADRWSRALALCRLAKDKRLWASFAALAEEKGHLDAAEEAFAATEQPHRVEYLRRRRLKNLDPDAVAF